MVSLCSKTAVLMALKAGAIDPDRAALELERLASSRLTSIVQVIEFCRARNLPADVVGRWVWVRFDSKPEQALLDEMKAAGFRWVRDRGEWAHNCGHASKRGTGAPRFKYGSIPVSQAAPIFADVE